MAENRGKDINSILWPCYDTGLLLKIIDFYSEKNIFEKKKLNEQKLKLLQTTSMIPMAKTLYKEMYKNENYPKGN
jgi:hypothetical protein